MTSFLIADCEIGISQRSHNDWIASYSPYSQQFWLGRIERNIQRESGSVTSPRSFTTEQAAISLVRDILKSIEKDYGVSFIEGDQQTIRKALVNLVYHNRKVSQGTLRNTPEITMSLYNVQYTAIYGNLKDIEYRVFLKEVSKSPVKVFPANQKLDAIRFARQLSADNGGETAWILTIQED